MLKEKNVLLCKVWSSLKQGDKLKVDYIDEVNNGPPSHIASTPTLV